MDSLSCSFYPFALLAELSGKRTGLWPKYQLEMSPHTMRNLADSYYSTNPRPTKQQILSPELEIERILDSSKLLLNYSLIEVPNSDVLLLWITFPQLLLFIL
jgi:hypothetical protein